MFYLYVKTHHKTGLKYLGQTSQNPYTYHGSGTYWRLHLQKYGYDYDTEVLHECQDKAELKEHGLYYSELWNIVESNEWANLKAEEGDGGCMGEEARRKISEAGLGRIPWNKGKEIWTEEDRQRIREQNRSRGPQSAETIAKRVEKNTGKKRSAKAVKNLTTARRKRAESEIVSEETRKKMSESATARGFNGYGFEKGCIPHNAAQVTIENVNTGLVTTATSLREWCREHSVSYGGMWKAFKEGRNFKQYRKLNKD